MVSGHVKGHLAIYEVKGLQSVEKYKDTTVFDTLSDRVFGDVQAKHHKTLDDIHKTTIISIKFVGDFSKDIQVVSCDLAGVVNLTTFTDGTFLFRGKT